MAYCNNVDSEVDSVCNIFNKASIKDELRIMTINVQNNNKGAKVESRRPHLLNLVLDKNPEFLILQECNEVDCTELNKMLKKKDMAIYKYIIEKKETAVMVKSKSLNMIKKENLNSFKQVSKTFKDINLLSNRLLLAETLFHEKEIIIGSWHGPRKSGNVLDKLSIVNQIIAFMNNMKKPWIVAGDFNLCHKTLLESSQHLNANISFSDKEPIVYFMHSDSISISNVSICDKGHDNLDRECFDHYPLIAGINVT